MKLITSVALTLGVFLATVACVTLASPTRNKTKTVVFTRYVREGPAGEEVVDVFETDKFPNDYRKEWIQLLGSLGDDDVSGDVVKLNPRTTAKPCVSSSTQKTRPVLSFLPSTQVATPSTRATQSTRATTTSTRATSTTTSTASTTELDVVRDFNEWIATQPTTSPTTERARKIPFAWVTSTSPTTTEQYEDNNVDDGQDNEDEYEERTYDEVDDDNSIREDFTTTTTTTRSIFSRSWF